MTNLPDNLKKYLSSPLDEIPKDLYYNREFVIELAKVVTDDDTFYNRIAKPFKQDIDIVKVLLRYDHVSLENYKKLRSTPEIIEAAMAGNPNNIDFVPAAYKKNREWVLPFLREDGFVYRYIADYYTKDVELARIAAETYPATLVFASAEITKDKQVALSCVGQDPSMVSFMDSSLRTDKDVAWAVAQCKNNESALSLFSKDILNDDNIMREAVKNCTNALRYASERITGDLDFMIKLVRKDINAVQYASEDIKNNLLFAHEVISIEPFRWKSLGDDLVAQLHLYVNGGFEPIQAIEKLLLHEELQKLPQHTKSVPKNKI